MGLRRNGATRRETPIRAREPCAAKWAMTIRHVLNVTVRGPVFAVLLAACSSVSLGPAPVQVVTAPQPRPASAPPPAAAPAAAPPVAIASPVTPQTPQTPSSAPPSASPAADDPKLTESPVVAARLPDPPVCYRTPALEPGRAAFTSNAEIHTL